MDRLTQINAHIAIHSGLKDEFDIPSVFKLLDKKETSEQVDAPLGDHHFLVGTMATYEEWVFKHTEKGYYIKLNTIKGYGLKDRMTFTLYYEKGFKPNDTTEAELFFEEVRTQYGYYEFEATFKTNQLSFFNRKFLKKIIPNV